MRSSIWRYIVPFTLLLAAPVQAGGLSGDVARQAMCEDFLAWCVAEPMEEPTCTEAPQGASCLIARITRDATCLDRYELCLTRERGDDT